MWDRAQELWDLTPGLLHSGGQGRGGARDGGGILRGRQGAPLGAEDDGDGGNGARCVGGMSVTDDA